MQEMARPFRLMKKIAIAAVLLMALLWLATPLKAVFAGMILGSAISLYNIFHLGFRLRLAGESILKGSKKLSGINTMVRILMVGFGILLVYRFPQWIDYHSYVLSLLFGYLLLVFSVSFFHIKNTSLHHEGREVLGTDTENNVPGSDL